MGQNIFRFTLSHTSGSKVISEPDGWAKIKIALERDKEYFSLVELIETPFIFYGTNGVYDGGMNYLLEKKQNYGIDAQISILIEISQDEINFENLFLGLIDMQSFRTIDSRKLEVAITRSNKWATFFSRRDTPVDINSTTDLDGNSVSNGNSMTINLPSQKIQQKYDGYVSQNVRVVNFGDGGTGNLPYLILDFDKEVLDEIDEKFKYTVQSSVTVPFEKFYLEYGGSYRIICGVTLWQTAIAPGSTDSYVNVYLQINGLAPTAFSKTNRTIPSSVVRRDGTTINLPLVDNVTDYYIDTTLDLNPGDSIRIYGLSSVSSPSSYIILTRGGFDKYWIAPNSPNAYTNFQEYWDASVNLFPSTSASGGTILSGMSWFISIPGNLGGTPVLKDWVIVALVNSPGQTSANWYVNEKGMIEGLYDFGDTYLTVTANTIYPDTQSEAFFLHDVGYEIIKRIVDDNSFYSEYTGSTHTLSLAYPSDGCGWNHSLVRGLQLRLYSLLEKPFSISFKQWWEGINPIQNLGLGYDIVGGNEVIRVEEKSFFFNDTPIIYFDWVNNIEESIDKEVIYNKVKIGYKKWKSEDISGIDDPQTNHDYATLFRTVGQPITIQSEFIAASLPIEQTRRTTRKKSADYKFDDDTFIIAIQPEEDNSPIGYNPELDENFDSVSGLLNSNSRYNLTLTPLRNLIRWFNVLAGCLQDYPTSAFKFTGGEGNYDMVSDYSGSAPGICFNKISDPLSEKQDLSMSYNGLLGHLFRPELLEFKYPLSWDNYKLIRDNRTRAIAVSETDSNHTICHIKKLEYDVINSLGTFTVWRK